MANEAAILYTVFLDTSPPQMKMKDSRAEGYWILADRAAACSGWFFTGKQISTWKYV